MNEIKLINLNLRNFKGIKNFKLETQGRNAFIYGDNATGKTTIMDAFIWLLFDKDSQNSSNFNIKTLDKEGRVIHGLEHEVTAVIQINNKEIELKKIYKEKWTKKRGQADSELTGHITDYFINKVPKKKSEYQDYLKNIINEETFKIITNPLYFNTNLKWQDRRNIALNICKEIEDREIIKKDKSLESLEDLLADKSIDDLKAEVAGKRRRLNEELKSIPYRIDELSREDIEIDLEEVKEKKDKLENTLADIKANKGIDYDFRLRTIIGSIKKLKLDLEELEQSESEVLRGKISKLFENRNKVDKDLFKTYSSLVSAKKEVDLIEENLGAAREDILDLREEFTEISKLEFNENSTICPTCKQSLPERDILNFKNSFKENKANKLKNINKNGKELQEKLKNLEVELEEKSKAKVGLDEKHKSISQDLEAWDKEIEKTQAELKNIKLHENKEWREIQLKLEELKVEKDRVEDLKEKHDKVKEVKDIEDKISEINKELARVDLIKENEKRINELKKRERQLAQMVADTERTEFLCERFIITKANLLEDKLNSKFKLVKFKLFDLQVNGGINETFVTTANGVPFEDLNNASKINAGLDIIESLSDHYGLKAPIFIDNRESINKIIDTKSQIINLLVSKDKKLKTEVEND